VRLILSLSMLAALGFSAPSAAPAIASGVPPALADRQAESRPMQALFGTRETYSRDIAPFDKWTGMLTRFRQEADAGRRGCASLAPGCEPAEWHDALEALRGLDLRDQLDRVNAAVNRHPYVGSQRNWGESNYWETPYEFLRKGGQCQDYAITKYLMLRAAGIPAAQLRVLVLRDTKLGLDHAVAVAYVDGEPYVLDNQLGAVVPAASIRHYRPYYSINEEGWWLHTGPNARYASAADATLR
jgi:predicted transglutaminase-like cysteine proteinase